MENLYAYHKIVVNSDGTKERKAIVVDENGKEVKIVTNSQNVQEVEFSYADWLELPYYRPDTLNG